MDDVTAKNTLEFLCVEVNSLQASLFQLELQHMADMEAIRHELSMIWDAINELQGIEDPERLGEPDE